MKKGILRIAALCCFAFTLIFGVACVENNENHGGEDNRQNRQEEEIAALLISGKPENNAVLLSSGSLRLSVPEIYANAAKKWSSTDKSVATVDSAGKVSLLKGGETQISVQLQSDLSKRDSFILTVTDDINTATAESVEIVAPREQITLSQAEFSLNAAFDKDNCKDDFVWETDNSAVVEVKKSFGSGICSFAAKSVGKAKITVKSSLNAEVQSSCEIEVVETYRANDAVLLGMITDAVIKGESVSLAAKILPAEADGNAISWGASDTNVFTVNESGVLTAVSVGEAEVILSVENGNAAPLEKRFWVKVCERNAYYETFADVYFSNGTTMKGSMEITAVARNEKENIYLSVTNDENLRLTDTEYCLKVTKTGTSQGSWSFTDVRLPAVKNGEKYNLSFWLDFIKKPADVENAFYFGVLNPADKLIFPDAARPGDYCTMGDWRVAKNGKQNTISVEVNADYDYLTLRLLSVTTPNATDSEYTYVLDDVTFNRVLSVENPGSLGGTFVSLGADNYCRFTAATGGGDFEVPLGTVSCEIGKNTLWRGASMRLYAETFERGRYTWKIRVKNTSGKAIKLFCELNFAGKVTKVEELGDNADGAVRSVAVSYDLKEKIEGEKTFVQCRIFSMSENGHTFEIGDVSMDFEETYEFSNAGTLGGEIISVQPMNGTEISKNFSPENTIAAKLARISCGEGSGTSWRGISMRLYSSALKAGTYTIKFSVYNCDTKQLKLFSSIAGYVSKVAEHGALDAGMQKSYSVSVTAQSDGSENSFIQLAVFSMTETGHTFEIGDISIDYKEA